VNIETLLDLNPGLLANADEAALWVLQTTWEQQNRPEEAQKLVRVLKLTMDSCQRQGIVYPRIFLRRKGELIRGEFKPKTEIRSLPNVKFTATGHPAIPDEWIKQAIIQSGKDHERQRQSLKAKPGEGT
jgi:hypothetical protein